jgi:hypothetical protein
MVVRHAVGQSIIDVRRAFPSADGVRVGRGATAYTISLLTHAEYSKDKWK